MILWRISVRKLLPLIVPVILLTFVLNAQEKGSCQKYAEFVCEICGKKSAICAEALEKSDLTPENPACKKGLRLLPPLFENGSEEDKAKVKEALCEKKVPAGAGL